MDSQRREALLKEYGEVATSFRSLTDIRFRLLALLPIAAAAAAWLKGDVLGSGVASLGLSMFGSAATVGLVIYNARNDQLYNQLAARAAFIERSLGLPDGAFASRPPAWLTVRVLGAQLDVNHGTGVALIYTASSALWLVGLFAPLLEFARLTYVDLGLPHMVVRSPSSWTTGAAIALAVISIVLTTRSINAQIEERKKDMRRLAAEVVETILEGTNLPAVDDEHAIIKLCARLANIAPDLVLRRARLYWSPESDSLNRRLPSQLREQFASQMVAQLTNLPQGWILECYLTRSNTASSRQRART